MSFSGRTLVIDTASEACSIALFEGQSRIAHDHQVMGRGHAERLIPMIEALPQKGRAERILVSLGPGSFTGVRIGIAAARALGVAWGAKVLGYPTLALVSAQAQSQKSPPGHTPGQNPAPGDVTVCMNGGHGEWFVQNFKAGAPSTQLGSLTPQAAQNVDIAPTIAGNRAKELAQLFDGAKEALELLPDAGAAHLLEKSVLSDDLAPIYGRAPDAKPQTQQANR